MKLATFNYTKLDGTQSPRKVLVIGTPTNKLSGLDVTDMSDEEIGLLSVEYDRLHDEFLEKVEALKQEFDVKHNYRQFLETGIVDMELEIL